ncbi:MULTISPECIES: hypothetical protein [Flavobacterium]|uniref:Uncharacterized protein n=1 Tax=Flavobacterium salmonis TaxID=2654844 RepID=A0A6V6YNS1_9FLAO|nr:MULTISPECIES: hypothetical protein [Flavobacterium]OOV20432.1 hypothetical protein BXU10_12785 [Flavobacterium sp. LM4]CAD0001019.1 hypothetical protein FLAT13_00337 [Flavobacterium salmonis]
MKRIASLFLIVTLFYNVLGFYIMFAEQQQQVWVNAMEKTDNANFEIIEIKINPYAYVVDSGFEEVNEDLVIENKTYHVFKKRILNNVLKLYCLKNSHREVLSNDLKKIVDSQIFDTDSNKENPSKKLIKSFIQDYIPNDTINLVSTTTKLVFPVTLNSYSPKEDLLSGYFTTNYPPPNMV